MLFSIGIFLLLKINFLLNYWINIHLFFEKFETLGLIVFLVLGLFVILIYNFLKIKNSLKNKFVEINSEINTQNKEYQLYLLFVGLIIIIIEISFNIFNIRNKNLLFINFGIGLLFLIIYFLSEKSNYILKKIRKIFITLFIFYFVFITHNLILYNEKDIIPLISYIVSFYFSYSIMKPIRLYWIFVVAVAISLFTFLVYNLLPIETTIILFNFCLLTLILNYIRHISLLNTTQKLRFTNEIVNKGNILTIATNLKGELSFCSETIESILGYHSEQVLGMGFWKLTEDKEFIGKKYHDNYVNNRLYVRKLKCKNGEFKYIQWKDTKFTDDLFIGIGQDITEQELAKDQFKNLVQSANDIIFETDKHGNFTFINEFAEQTLGYNLEEIKNKHFSEFIRKDHIQKVLDFFENTDHKKTNLETIEIPVLKKNNEEFWVSQKVIAKKDISNKIIGFSAISRDISIFKNLEKEKLVRQEKNHKYNELLKSFTEKSYSNYQNFDSILSVILEKTTKTIGINRVSYWKYFPDKIKCEKLYDLNKDKFEKGYVLTKKYHPNYFKKLENDLQIVSSDVFNDSIDIELTDNYFPKNKIFSVINNPIYIDGKLKGIICFASTDEIKIWDNDDISFTKSIADLIVIAIETQKRHNSEKKLTYKSELLAALSLCTEKFLICKNTEEIFNEVLIIMGRATKSGCSFYYENDSKTNLLSQKNRWFSDNDFLSDVNENLQNLNHDYFEELLTPLLNNKYYSANTNQIRNNSLKSKLEKIKIVSLLILPIFVKNKFHGFMGFQDLENSRKWTEDEINIIQNLAMNVSLTIEKINNENSIYESEERFRLLANNIPGTIYLSKYDALYTKVYLNDEIEKLTGFPKSDFLDNTISFIDLIVEEDRENVLQKHAKLLLKRKPIHSIYRIRNKKNQIVWVEEFGEPIIKNNEITFIEGIFLDITNRKTTETAIKEKEIAELASKSKSEFLANMSHEIRTPLNGIIGFTDLLMNTKLEDFQKEYMNTINQSAKSLMDVISNILDFSKIESGKLELSLEKYNIKKLANQVIELIKYESKTKKIDLILNIKEDVPTFIWTDYIRLKQILINLLSNAVKFTHEGKIELKIESIKKENTKAILRFSVTDTGIGIKKNNQEKIFEAFLQEDRSTTKKFGGTGLGLSISNQLLGLANSHLQLESELGVGSRFYFDIKVKYSNEKEKQTFKIKNNIQDPESIESNVFFIDEKIKILIVEDNKINMFLIKTLIYKIIPNCIIFEATDGKEAIEQYKKVSPAMVLMDIQMPIMNGYEASKEIRKLEVLNNIPIIAITAGTVIGEKEKCLEAGMNDYIPKPIVKDDLEKIILKWVKTTTSMSNK